MLDQTTLEIKAQAYAKTQADYLSAFYAYIAGYREAENNNNK
jgi:hypothetical protein